MLTRMFHTGYSANNIGAREYFVESVPISFTHLRFIIKERIFYINWIVDTGFLIRV